MQIEVPTPFLLGKLVVPIPHPLPPQIIWVWDEGRKMVTWPDPGSLTW